MTVSRGVVVRHATTARVLPSIERSDSELAVRGDDEMPADAVLDLRPVRLEERNELRGRSDAVPKEEDPDTGEAQAEDQFAEVQVVGQDDTVLGARLREEDVVGRAGRQLHSSEDVVLLLSEPVHEDALDVGVREQLHAAGPSRTTSSEASEAAAYAQAARRCSRDSWGC